MIEIETFLFINKVLAVGGFICVALIIAIIIDLCTKKRLYAVFHRFGMWIMALIVAVSMTLTLTYSEVLGFTPCGLCWLERMFLYPQLVVILTGIYLKDKMAPYYILLLSIIGFVIGMYHHTLQVTGNNSLPCPASGGDCASAIMMEFGFVTFPLLAAVAFAFLFTISLYLIRTSSQELVD